MQNNKKVTPLPEDFIVVGVPSDLNYLIHLQKKWSNNLGFLPKTALQRYLRNQQALVVHKNGEPAGYLLWDYSKRDNLIKIPQVAIEASLLRTGIGTLVMKQLETAATNSSCTVLRLRSRTDLEANNLWPTLGWFVSAVFYKQNARNLPVYEWTRQLTNERQQMPTQQRTPRKPIPEKPQNHQEKLLFERIEFLGRP